MTTATKATKMDRFIEEAARKLVQDFSETDGEMLAQAHEKEHGDPLPVPMWSALFKVGGFERDKIRALMVSRIPDDERSALGRLIDNGLGLGDDLSAFYTCSECAEGIKYEAREVFDALEDKRDIASPCCKATVDVDEPGLVEATREAWQESGDDDYDLAAAGWSDVGDTGIIAFDHDGDIFLGVNGAGYSFYDSHWIPLYKALAYEWHIGAFRQEQEAEAVSALCKAVEKGNEAAIVRAARKVAKRRAARQQGGPLSKNEQREADAER